MLLESNGLARHVAAHHPTSTVRTGIQGIWIAQTARDVRTRAHGAGNNAHHTMSRVDCALAREQARTTEVRFAGNIVVVTVHGFVALCKLGGFSNAECGGNSF